MLLCSEITKCTTHNYTNEVRLSKTWVKLECYYRLQIKECNKVVKISFLHLHLTLKRKINQAVKLSFLHLHLTSNRNIYQVTLP